MKEIKRVHLILGAILLVLLVGLAISAPTIKDHYIKSKLEAQVELEESIKNMAKATSYQYTLKSGFTVDNREEVISEIVGEKDGENTHIKGEMVNTPVDIYYIESTIYNYDSFSQKWLVIDSDTTNSEELLISELNPLSNFKFKKINDVEKLRFENIDGTECLVVMCKPSIESQLLESLWRDFSYEIWIDYKNRFITKASLRATNKQMSNTQLDLEVEFSDINQKISIVAPIERK